MLLGHLHAALGVSCHDVGFLAIGALHLHKAVGRVANPTGQDFAFQHCIDHCTLAVGSPVNQCTYVCINGKNLVIK